MNKNDIIKHLFLNTKIYFLFGAGTSYNIVDKKIAFPLMSDLLSCIKENTKIKNYYEQIRKEWKADGLIIKSIYDNYLFSKDANVETFLSVLDGVELYLLDKNLKKQLNQQLIDIKTIIRDRINESDTSTVIDLYSDFYRGLINLKEHNSIKNQVIGIFTTNYDMMNELVMEDLNIHYYSGFDGLVNRMFKPAYYNYSYIDRFKYNNRSIINDTNHVNLYKLHGSLSWFKNEDNEIVELNPSQKEFVPEIIYPSVDKFNNTNLIVNFSSLLREFSNCICEEKTTLVVCGMSMGDEHINKIIENALAISSFHLIVYCFAESDITKVINRFGTLDNVIIVGPKATFKMLTNFINDLGENSNEKS